MMIMAKNNNNNKKSDEISDARYLNVETCCFLLLLLPSCSVRTDCVTECGIICTRVV